MEQPELLVSREGRYGRIRLNRPKALNSLTLDMVRRFTRALADFAADPDISAVLVTGEGERGLCAGGDIRRLYDLRDGDKTSFKDFWREEYQLNAMIARYEKPYVVVMDGLVMGGGVGISAHGNCRIVTERTRLAMPETGIGFVPDVGGTWLLTRAGGAGIYLALSGVTISGADAVDMGLADALIDSRDVERLLSRLSMVDDLFEAKAQLQEAARQLEAGELAQNKRMLDAIMSRERVEDILSGLDQDGSAFALGAAKQIRDKSPTSLKVTYALLKRATMAANLETCLVNEFRAACGLLGTHDLYEGIRAAIVDKDRSPRWRPSLLEDVTDETVRQILKGDGAMEPRFQARV